MLLPSGTNYPSCLLSSHPLSISTSSAHPKARCAHLCASAATIPSTQERALVQGNLPILPGSHKCPLSCEAYSDPCTRLLLLTAAACGSSAPGTSRCSAVSVRAVLLKVWSPDLQHLHPLEPCQKCRFSDLTLEPLDEKVWAWGPGICLNPPSGL